MQKVRHHMLSHALTACTLTVSGSISLPSRGSFHRSLSVLFAIGHYSIFSLGRWSSLLQSTFLVCQPTQVSYLELYRFKIRDFHPLRSPFPQTFSYLYIFSLHRTSCAAQRMTLLPRIYIVARLYHIPGLGSSPFARRYLGNLS